MTPKHDSDLNLLQKLPTITHEYWLELGQALEDRHAIFYQIWDMGKPIFTTRLNPPTAAVKFNEQGDFVAFMFHPEFWNSRTDYERLFVICHEALHIILNHGARIRDTTTPRMCNVALDIVVNHLLVNGYGFDRYQISDQDKLCWVDTVFKNPDGTPMLVDGQPTPDDQCFEYYYNLLKRHQDQGEGEGGLEGEGGSGLGKGCKTVDDHSIIGDSDFREVVKRLAENLSEEELQDLADSIEKYYEDDVCPGTVAGNSWHLCKVVSNRKKKWETIIKNWAREALQEGSREQWAVRNRRYVSLPDELFLPTEIDSDGEELSKIRVRFYLDTSGSCWDLKDRFFKAAKSLSPDRFDVRLFCFDTKVHATTLKSGEVFGGGGTRFDILETSIQQELKAGGKYPDAVFVITDGMGTPIKPAQPKKWYWFLSEDCTNLIPKESKIYKLKDFE